MLEMFLICILGPVAFMAVKDGLVPSFVQEGRAAERGKNEG